MANLVEGEWDWQNPQGQDVALRSKRKQRLADMLRKQSSQPQGQMIGNIFVPPSILQNLASGANALYSNKLDREAGDEMEGAIKERQQQMQTASQRLAEALRPKQVQEGETKQPFEPNQMNQFGTPMEGQLQRTVPNMVQKQPTPQDLMMAQLQYAQDVGDPRLMQQAVGQQLNYGLGQQQREDEQAFRSQEAKANREARMQEMAIKIEEGRASRQEQMEFRREMQQQQLDARRDMNNQNVQARRDMAQLTASLKKPPSSTPNINWKYDAGSDEFVAPPTPEYPQGLRSGSVAKSNAGQSMDYIINQFKGGNGKKGVLDKTMQGGALGMSGQIGKVVDYQDQKRFENLKEQMSTELRTLFRIPGEGALSDREQAQYGIQLPDVKYDKSTNESILADVQNRIKLRTQTPNPLKPATSQIIPQGQAGGSLNGGWSVKRK